MNIFSMSRVERGLRPRSALNMDYGKIWVLSSGWGGIFKLAPLPTFRVRSKKYSRTSSCIAVPFNLSLLPTLYEQI